MEELLEKWNINTIRELRPIPSHWGNTSLVSTTDGSSYILKKKKDLSQTEGEFNLLSNLSAAGAPVAVPIPATNGEHYVLYDDQIYCLYPELPGRVIEDHYRGNAKERARSFGKAIASLHSSFLKCEKIEGIPNMNLIGQLREWAMPCIRNHEHLIDASGVEENWKSFEAEMIQLEADLPKQMIHRDIHPANMLFEDGEVSGFIDFEIVVIGPRVFDLCYCGTSILVGGFDDPAKREMWFGLFQSLFDGYQEVSPFLPSEIKSIKGTLAAIELLFMAFSLETNAVEAAQYNARVLDWLSKNQQRIHS